MKAKKRQQERKNKDVFFEKLSNSKALYLILLGCVLVYLYGDDRVLNLPVYLFMLKFTIILILVLVFIAVRYFKYKSYYRKKIQDKVYVTVLILGLIIFSLIMQGVINIPLNYIIKIYSKNSLVESFNCEITNVVVTKVDKIHFRFKGKQYYRYFNVNDFDRKDLIHNYWLNIKARKSVWNTYYIESMDLQNKN